MCNDVTRISDLVSISTVVHTHITAEVESDSVGIGEIIEQPREQISHRFLSARQQDVRLSSLRHTLPYGGTRLLSIAFQDGYSCKMRRYGGGSQKPSDTASDHDGMRAIVRHT